MQTQSLVWASTRILFHAYMAFCVVSVAGGWVTAPLFTWCFYGDWRFWRYVRPGLRLFLHGYKFVPLILKLENSGFMFAVPLASAPLSSPDRGLVQLNPSWDHGTGCGPCTRCCTKIECPILEPETGLCSGYDSFFWRYFNCGRYPSNQSEIDYYECPKWLTRPAPVEAPASVPEPEAGLGAAG